MPTGFPTKKVTKSPSGLLRILYLMFLQMTLSQFPTQRRPNSQKNTVFRPTVLPFVPEQNHEFRPTLGPFVPKASKIEITKPKQDKMKKPQTVKVDIEDTDSDSYSDSNSYSNSDSNSDTDSEINENNEVITEFSDSSISLEINDSDLFN